MAPKQMISLRIDADARREIEEAARRRGKSMTDYMVDAAQAQVRRDAQTQARRDAKRGEESSPIRFRGVPTFFAASCHTAKAGGTGYEGAGWTLGMHAADMLYGNTDGDEDQALLDEKLNELGTLISEEDIEGTWAWFKREFPRCMELVPTRRRESFVRGVFTVAEDRDILSY